MIIGIAGKTGAGKTSVAEYLIGKGYFHIDLDKYGHKALEQIWSDLLERFGDVVIGKYGSIDRKALAQIVFNDQSALEFVENKVHPLMCHAIKWDIDNHSLVVIEGYLLHRFDLGRKIDILLWIDCPWLIRFLRLCKRDKNFMGILDRMKNQKGMKEDIQELGYNRINNIWFNRACSNINEIIKERA